MRARKRESESERDLYGGAEVLLRLFTVHIFGTCTKHESNLLLKSIQHDTGLHLITLLPSSAAEDSFCFPLSSFSREQSRVRNQTKQIADGVKAEEGTRVGVWIRLRKGRGERE